MTKDEMETLLNKEDVKFDDIFTTFIKLPKEEAIEFFSIYVKALAKYNNISEEEALECGKRNFGYFAGYFSNETQKQVQSWLNCVHPIFGKIEDYENKSPEYFENLAKSNISK